ncbi:RNA polymerase-associated protein CTR9 homolog [Scaptodrosophila lebanonensis]|uniref:RNA polymerase-associated protein CTR9 homolog n=1 Tax=Drosophila lebanonensis TaxID=7225 RepID=A0A6J2UJC5_DROLE|nr:RNA polymerase-associated protein CTR9 homolog [Scaptodrosophila lebanonensis]
MTSSKSSNNLCEASDIIGDVDETLSMLSVNRMYLRIWIQKALAYYNLQQYENFVRVLEHAISRCNKSYPGYQEDLIRTYSLLAAYYTRLAYHEVSNRRAVLQAKATNLFNVVDDMRSTDRHHLVSHGFALLLTAGRAQEADNIFIGVLQQCAYNVPSLIGRACVAFNRRDYRAALGYFKSVLRFQPRGPGDVRVGMAHCFLRLHDVQRARRCFELALEYNSRCANALLGLALLKLNEGTVESNREGISMLSVAYELNTRNPQVLVHLAHHFFYTRNFEKLRILAGNAFQNSDNKEIQTRASFQIARSYHAEGNYDQAFEFYLQAVRIASPTFVLPQLGLAQMYLHRKQLDKAEPCLQAVLKVLPNYLLAMRILGTLYRNDKARSKLDTAIDLFKQVVLCSDDDYESWLSLAFLYERKALWEPALHAFEQAKRVYETRPGDPSVMPVEWLNNMAALHMYDDHAERAIPLLDEALARAGPESNALTIRFNLARAQEQLRNFELAEKSYKDLIVEYPTYIDSYLRLGVMAYSQNQLVTATEYFKDALKVDEANLAARTYLGNHYVKQGHVALGMHNYNAILRHSHSVTDSYTLIAVGNVCLHNIQKAEASGDQMVAKRNQEKSLEFFKRAFEKNPCNIWAANGIGAALSSRGMLTEGGTIFKQVVESSNLCTDAAVNLAHVALQLGQYPQACQTYRHCLEHLGLANNVKLLQHLAYTLLHGKRYNEAKMALLRARHLAPFDEGILFNLGLVISLESVAIFGKKRPLLEELESAEHQVEVAQRFFEYVVAIKGSQGLMGRLAAVQAKNCRQLLEAVPAHLSRVRDLLQLDVIRLQEQEQRYREQQEQEEEADRQRQLEEKKLREKQYILRQEMLERTKAIINFVVPPPEKKKKGRRKGDTDEMEEEGNEDDAAGEVGGKRPRKRGRGRKKKLDDRPSIEVDGYEAANWKSPQPKPRKRRAKKMRFENLFEEPDDEQPTKQKDISVEQQKSKSTGKDEFEMNIEEPTDDSDY